MMRQQQLAAMQRRQFLNQMAAGDPGVQQQQAAILQAQRLARQQRFLTARQQQLQGQR